MPTIGDTTKPDGGGYWEQFGSTYNQSAMLLTMPEDGRIVALGQWISAVGSPMGCRLVVWDASTLDVLAQTAEFTVANEPAGVGNVSRYEVDLTSPLSVAAGVDFWVGFARDPAKTHQLTGDNSGSHVDRKRTSWPGSMSGYDAGDHGFGGYGIGSYVAGYVTASGAKIYRAGAWVSADAVKVYRSGAWADVSAVKVRRSSAWADAS